MRVDEIAKLVGGQVEGDGGREVTAVAGLDAAGATDISFADSERSLELATRSAAGCIIVPRAGALAGRTTVVVDNPKLALIRAAAAILLPQRVFIGVHSTAVVDPSAQLSAGVSIGAHAVVEPGVKIGARTIIGAGVVVGRGVEIGADCMIHSGVHIYPDVQIGNLVILHSGVIIGTDGFGYVFAEGRHQKFPQLGQVVIEDDVEIGANTTIDRGSLGTTVIGQGSKIDNLVQIAHNVRVGRHCVIAAQSGIAGSSVIGDYVVLAGQVGISDKVRIEDRVIIGAQSGIPTGKVVRAGRAMMGSPARPLASFKKIYAHWVNLPNLAKKVERLSRQLASQSKSNGS